MIPRSFTKGFLITFFKVFVKCPLHLFLGEYIRFVCAAMFSMFLGSQCVHNYYKPLQDLDKFVEEEVKNLPEDQRKKIKL